MNTPLPYANEHKFAHIYWKLEDLTHNYELSDEEALDILEENEEEMMDAMDEVASMIVRDAVQDFTNARDDLDWKEADYDQD
jgi:hypothetical protein